jgi:hypothetical protein
MVLALVRAALDASAGIGVPAFVADGGVIGGLRHHDFTPWDDDIDVSLFVQDPLAGQGRTPADADAHAAEIRRVHAAFDRQFNNTVHPRFGRMMKTAMSEAPWCYYKHYKNNNCVREGGLMETTHRYGRPFAGVFRIYFLENTRRSRWRYGSGVRPNGEQWGCVGSGYKGEGPKCPRFPIVEVFLWAPALNATIRTGRMKQHGPAFRPVPGFFGALPKALVGDLARPPRQMLFHGHLLPVFSDAVGYLRHRYDLNASGLEHGVCVSGTNHKSSGHRGMPLREPQPCNDLWNVVPFVRVRHQGPCNRLAQTVGWAAAAAATTKGTCRMEIAMKGRAVTSIFLSMLDNEKCGESFLVVAPPAEGPPGHAIDDEVWTT